MANRANSGLVASCMRLASLFIILSAKPPDPVCKQVVDAKYSTDLTIIGTSSNLLAWTVVECGMYNAAASLICLRPLYGKIPRVIRQSLGLHVSSKSTRSNRMPGATTIWSQKMDKRWIRMDPDDAHSTVGIVQPQRENEAGDVELEERWPTNRPETSPALEPIRIDRTCEVSSAIVLNQKASQAQPDHFYKLRGGWVRKISTAGLECMYVDFHDGQTFLLTMCVYSAWRDLFGLRSDDGRRKR